MIFITKPFDEEQLAARLRVAERIRSPISAEPVSSHSGIIPVTVSVGVMIVAIALARMEPRLLRPRTGHSTGQKRQAVTGLNSRMEERKAYIKPPCDS